MPDDTILTDEQIAEMESRANAATPGPWNGGGEFSSNYVYTRYGEHRSHSNDGGKTWVNCTGWTDGFCVHRENDAHFISAARTDIPSLISSHEAMRKLQRETSLAFIESENRAAALQQRLSRLESTPIMQRLAKAEAEAAAYSRPSSAGQCNHLNKVDEIDCPQCLRVKLSAAIEKVRLAEQAGAIFGMMKEAGKEPRLMMDFREGSELARSDEASCDLIVVEAQRDAALAKLGEAEKWKAIAIRACRHIRNTDQIPAIQWGSMGMGLLCSAREIDPELYDFEIKGIFPSPSPSEPKGEAK